MRIQESGADRGPVEPELLEIFLQEAATHLQTIRSSLPALESGGADAVQAVRRAAHTLKGSAAVVGFGSLSAWPTAWKTCSIACPRASHRVRISSIC